MMSLDNSIVRKIYGTVIPLEGSVCVGGGGGGGGGGRVLSLSFFLLHMLDTSSYCFPLKYIWYIYPGAFLIHFIEYTLLKGSGGYPPPPCMGSGAKPVAKNSFRAFQNAKMSPQDTQLNTISYIFLPKSN